MLRCLFGRFREETYVSNTGKFLIPRGCHLYGRNKEHGRECRFIAPSLGDIEPAINPGAFIDENYQAGNPATLANNWANLVNPLNPGASLGLQRFGILQADVNAVDILMESNGLGINPGNPVTNLLPLANDDYSMRQFLYPSLTQLPEPGTLMLFASDCCSASGRCRAGNPCRAL
jgi:hypothetical protein